MGVSRKVPFLQRAAAWGALLGRFLENCRALTVQKYGLPFSCWNVLWAIWSLAQTAMTWVGSQGLFRDGNPSSFGTQTIDGACSHGF